MANIQEFLITRSCVDADSYIFVCPGKRLALAGHFFFIYTLPMSHHIYSTDGFVVKSSGTGEAAVIFHIFTRELGMVVATAQGIRLSTSKLRSYVHDLAFSHFSLVRGKDFWRLTGASHARHDFLHTFSKQQLRLYAQILTLLKRLLQGEEKNSELFSVVENTFVFLQEHNLSHDQFGAFEHIIVLRILSNLGYINAEGDLEKLIHEPLNLALFEIPPALRSKCVQAINHAFKVSHI
jgi:hypothetical protein